MIKMSDQDPPAASMLEPVVVVVVVVLILASPATILPSSSSTNNIVHPCVQLKTYLNRRCQKEGKKAFIRRLSWGLLIKSGKTMIKTFTTSFATSSSSAASSFNNRSFTVKLES